MLMADEVFSYESPKVDGIEVCFGILVWFACVLSYAVHRQHHTITYLVCGNWILVVPHH